MDWLGDFGQTCSNHSKVELWSNKVILNWIVQFSSPYLHSPGAQPVHQQKVRKITHIFNCGKQLQMLVVPTYIHYEFTPFCNVL